jgi:hypothetical protein
MGIIDTPHHQDQILRDAASFFVKNERYIFLANQSSSLP